jgi:hypothetical protein
MNKIIMTLVVMAAMLCCTTAQQTAVNNAETQAINATQFACAMTTVIDTAPEVALVCGIIKEGEVLVQGMTTFIESLIDMRKTQQASGKSYDVVQKIWVATPVQADAGSDANAALPPQPGYTTTSGVHLFGGFPPPTQ